MHGLGADARDNCQSQHAEDSSHGLSLLKSRFQLYRFDSSTASTYGPSTCLQDLERQHSVKQQLPRIPSAQLDMGRNASGEYRHMFMSRAYAERGCSMVTCFSSQLHSVRQRNCCHVSHLVHHRI